MERPSKGEGSMVVLDTGFFVSMLKGNHDAKDIWHKLREEGIRPIVSALTIGELLYILLRDRPLEAAQKVVDKIQTVGKVVAVGVDVARKGGELKDKHKVPYVDSLIVATVLLSGCEELITSDRKHMGILKEYGITVKILREPSVKVPEILSL
jgi:predicted nucleic acid-binding protein